VGKLQWDKHCTELLAQEERGDEKGTLHIQGYVGFSSQKSLNQMIKFLPRADCANTECAAYKQYVCKPNTRVEGGHSWKWSRKEYEDNKELKERELIRDAITENGHMLKDWQIEIENTIQTTPDFRTIHWYWSEIGGVGKTQFARYLYKKGVNLFYGSGKGDNIKGAIVSHFQKTGNHFDVIIYAVPRGCRNDQVSYKVLEEVKDAIFFSPRYESSMYVGNPPHIFVIANCEPIRGKLSDDRWKVKNVDDISDIVETP
jgi:hypothetical protein